MTNDTHHEPMETEAMRRQLAAVINARMLEREDIQAHYGGPVWNTDELTKEFKVISFLAPYVCAVRKSDGVKGSLVFQHRPRYYFDWEPISDDEPPGEADLPEQLMKDLGSKFTSNKLVATAGVLNELEERKEDREMPAFIERHFKGDWGTMCEEDKQLNEESLGDGNRLMSQYETESGLRIWIITEAVGPDGKRSVTTVLLPSEY